LESKDEAYRGKTGSEAAVSKPEDQLTTFILSKSSIWNVTYEKVMITAALVFLASAVIHWPSFHIYSDITTSFWSRTNASGVPYLTYEIPYAGYAFEYPPICGLVVWLGGWISNGNLYAYAAVEFAILGAFFVSTAHFLFRFLERLRINHNLQLIFTLFVPSAVALAAYNFDVINAFFIVLSLYLFTVKGKTNLSAMSLGFAVATKLFPILLLPLFIQDQTSFKKKIMFLLISIGVPLSLNLPFVLANYPNWLSGYLYLKNWGLEDTFLLWIFRSSSHTFAEVVSGILILVSSCAVYFLLRKQSIIYRAFLIVGSFLLFSYISTPQLNLDLLPFFALVPLVPLPLFYLLEASNISFISLWDSFPNPSLPGLVQAIALARQICLGLILAVVVVRRSRIRLSTNEKAESESPSFRQELNTENRINN
jgi:hypothetical protein